MNEILKKQVLSELVVEFRISQPEIAAKARAGQFVVLRLHERGERIPLTIADWDRAEGTVDIVVQEAGKTTRELNRLEEGSRVSDIAGPLGVPSHIEKFGTVACVGGGVGIAALHPVARAMKNAGNTVHSILGARNRGLLIWEDRMKQASHEVHVTTDDGSCGSKGLVTDELKRLMDKPVRLDLVFAVGPVVMMKAVSELTRPSGLKTFVSLNPVMVDATGMCGACRVRVGEETRFVCVDGPDFDGHLVDYRELLSRQRMYARMEKESYHRCKMEEEPAWKKTA